MKTITLYLKPKENGSCLNFDYFAKEKCWNDLMTFKLLNFG